MITINKELPPNCQDCDIANDGFDWCCLIEDIVSKHSEDRDKRCPLKEQDNNPWHIGRPTEDGEYVCTIKINTTDRDDRPFECVVNQLLVFKDGYATNNIIGEPHEIIRYLKVEPYEESKE